jgi:hypothetical protein
MKGFFSCFKKRKESLLDAVHKKNRKTILEEVKTPTGSTKLQEPLTIYETNKLAFIYTKIRSFKNSDGSENKEFPWANRKEYTSTKKFCYFIIEHDPNPTNDPEKDEYIQTWILGKYETQKKLEKGMMCIIGGCGEIYGISTYSISKYYSFYSWFQRKPIPKNPKIEDFQDKRVIVSECIRYVCRYNGEKFTIIATWGEAMVVEKNDYIAVEYDEYWNLIGTYRIKESEFDRTYKPIPK